MIKLYKKLFIPKNTIQGHLPYLTLPYRKAYGNWILRSRACLNISLYFVFSVLHFLIKKADLK